MGDQIATQPAKNMRALKYMVHPRKLLYALGRHGLAHWIPDRLYLTIVYRGETGRKLDLNNPRSFTEKLQWLKIHDRRPEYIVYVDKYLVRSHIAKTIGVGFLVPIIAIYDSVEDICWDELPNQFVLKCTHGSHANIICTDKRRLDIDQARMQLAKWMKRNWFWGEREWPYKEITPRIICEELLIENGQLPTDYKVMCFGGEARLIQVHLNRFSDHHTQDFYDVHWIKTPIDQGGGMSDIVLPRPAHFEEMLRLSEKLASGIPQVRVDWYEVRGRLFFGEITFFDASGFERFDDERDELRLGTWIPLEEAAQEGGRSSAISGSQGSRRRSGYLG